MNQRNKIGKAILLCLLVMSMSITVEAVTNDYTLSYDRNGNLNQGFNEYLEYNEFNQLVRLRQNNSIGPILEEYLYDQNGERIKKYEPLINQTTYYISDNYIEIINSTGTYSEVYYYEDDVLVGRKDSSGRKYFNHPDHLGSTNIVTNENGVLVEESTYKPYGSIIDDGSSRFLFTGKELDDNTGMYYYGARYYDPFFKHFTQPDQNIPDIYNPQDLNRYAYVRNNPYKYVDPTGDVPVDVVIDIAFIAYGAYQFARDPSLKTFGSLTVDIGFALVPFVPNVKRLAEGVKLADKGLDAAKASRELTQQEGRIIKSLDRIEKDILDRKTIEGIARESKGEIVGRAAGDLRPTDHLKKVTDAQKGLRDDLNVLQRSLKDPKLTGTQRQTIEKAYGKASRQYDITKRITKKYKK